MKKNKGFTLVEIIVILVILAILAAVLIPSLTHYIDKAKEKQITSEARSALMATQTLLSESYAKYGNVSIGTLSTGVGMNKDEKISIQGFVGDTYAKAKEVDGAEEGVDYIEFDNEDIRKLAEIAENKGCVFELELETAPSCQIKKFVYKDYATGKTAEHDAATGVWDVKPAT